MSCQTFHDDDLDRRTTSIGRVHPHLEIKIHPDIEDVQVIGVPDAKDGVELRAWIVEMRETPRAQLGL